MKLRDNKELIEAVEKFLDLLYEYDCVGEKAYWRAATNHFDGEDKLGPLWTRKDYWYEVARKYIHIGAPYARLVIRGDVGAVYHTKGRNMPNFNKPVGNIFKMLKKKDWGRTIKRQYSRRKQGMGLRGEWSWVENHDLSHKPGGHKKCEQCGRNINVRRTLNGHLCQYCRGSASRHMGIVRQLGGTPTCEGKELHQNEDFLVD